MNKSESIGNLAKALSNVQKQLKPAIKDSQNPFFKSSYADLNSVWDACRDLLGANNLAVTQLNQVTDLGVIIETVLMHESGEWISGEMLLPTSKHDAQGVGSAITYGRRYGLAAIIGIVSDVDDDGNAASQPKQQAYARPNGTPGRITEKQEKFLIDLCNQTNSLAGDVAKWASAGRTEKTEELTAEEAKKAIEKLKVKQGQK